MHNNETTNTLPEGWIWTTIPELFVIIGGGTPAKNNISFWNGDINWASVKDIKSKYLSETIDKISKAGVEYSNTNIANKGDLILVTRISPGQVAIVKKPTAVNQDLKILKIFGSMPYEFVYYLLCSFKNKFIEHSSGTTVKGLKINDLNGIKLPLPPLEEQYLIVSKIEELFSELDHAEEGLKKAQKQLKVYKQALLKSAFDGKLTENWRKENNLSSTLKKVTLNQVCEKITDGSHYSPKTISVGYPYITVKDIKNDQIDFLNSKQITKTDFEKLVSTGCNPRVDDILFSKDGTVGKVSLINFSKEFVVLSSLAILRPKKEIIIPAFLFFSLKNGTFLLQALENKKGVAIRRIVLKDLKTLEINLFNKDEQKQIVLELESKFTLIENLDSTITKALKNLDFSRQSILRKAFEGRLTPQNSNEESGLELVSRIQKEKQSYLEKLKLDEREKPKRKATMEKSNLSVKEVLQNQSEPNSAKQIWKQSKFQDDSNIDLFYAELKELEEFILIKPKGNETLIAWRNENQ